MSGGEWLVAPDNEEPWLVMREGSLRLVTVCLARKLCWPVEFAGSPTGWPIGDYKQWHRAPSPPPPPLPKSRTVEMRADVIRRSHNWQGRIFAGETLINCMTTCLQKDAIAWARSWSACDPEVVSE